MASVQYYVVLRFSRIKFPTFLLVTVTKIFYLEFSLIADVDSQIVTIDIPITRVKLLTCAPEVDILS